MRVTLVLPAVVRSPVGSLKVAYELANRLQRRGHRVRALHVDASAAHGRPLVRARHRLRFRLWQLGWGSWFRLDPGIETGLLSPDGSHSLPSGDAVVAVGWGNARLVSEAPAHAGRKSYLVQGYMAPWEGAPGEVDEAWRLPLRKIVISRWLEEKAREICGPTVDVVRVPIAIDGAEFPLHVQPEARQPATVAMLYHPASYRGSADGIQALELVRRAHPELSAVAFGTQRPADPLPDWIRFEYRPRDLSGLYNSAAIFLHATWTDGWPLPPAEAMSSGCALVAAATSGIQEYAVDERNALLAPVQDVSALAEALVRLIDDDQLRVRLARRGMEDIRAFDWDTATSAFEAAISG